MKNSVLSSGILAVIIFITGSSVSAQNDQQTVKVTPEEAVAVKKIEQAQTIEEKLSATEAFIQKYPQSPARNQAANYIAGQITQLNENAKIISTAEKYMTIFGEPSEADLVLPTLIFSYVEQNRHKEAFAAAEKYLARNPGDVTVRIKLAAEAANLARQGNNEFAAQGRQYAQRAIELIEANQKPAELSAENWQEYQTKWLPQLYQYLGLINYHTANRTQARDNFQKSARLAPKDVNNWIMLGSMLNEEYQDLAKRHTASTSIQEQKELLTQASQKLDEVIQMYARIVALTEGDPSMAQIHKQVREDLVSYYKYRNNNSTEGLQELINKYKTQTPLG